jgi:fatty-acyl-CoA synthase/long-chain acyl-CoA synthetase
MLSAMIEEQARRPRDLSSLRVVMSGGAPVAPELQTRAELAFGCPIISVYGQTELSPIVCATDISDEVQDRATTSGRPLPQVEVCIADPSNGAAVPIGTEGEIRARGYQTMLGYVGQPDATTSTLLPDGWLCTGDLGVMDPRGFVRITGRLSDMIIRGGENIYPAEIEAVLLRHEAIAEAAVFGVADSYWGETVGAALRFRPDIVQPTVEELKQHCRVLLSPQKTPTSWHFVSAFPITASGKIQKFALAEQLHGSGQVTADPSMTC